MGCLAVHAPAALGVDQVATQPVDVAVRARASAGPFRALGDKLGLDVGLQVDESLMDRLG
jgi:hypothetical protein